jgi:hypothetical protein
VQRVRTELVCECVLRGSPGGGRGRRQCGMQRQQQRAQCVGAELLRACLAQRE